MNFFKNYFLMIFLFNTFENCFAIKNILKNFYQDIKTIKNNFLMSQFYYFLVNKSLKSLKSSSEGEQDSSSIVPVEEETKWVIYERDLPSHLIKTLNLKKNGDVCTLYLPEEAFQHLIHFWTGKIRSVSSQYIEHLFDYLDHQSRERILNDTNVPIRILIKYNPEKIFTMKSFPIQSGFELIRISIPITTTKVQTQSINNITIKSQLSYTNDVQIDENGLIDQVHTFPVCEIQSLDLSQRKDLEWYPDPHVPMQFVHYTTLPQQPVSSLLRSEINLVNKTGTEWIKQTVQRLNETYKDDLVMPLIEKIYDYTNNNSQNVQPIVTGQFKETGGACRLFLNSEVNMNANSTNDKWTIKFPFPCTIVLSILFKKKSVAVD